MAYQRQHRRAIRSHPALDQRRQQHRRRLLAERSADGRRASMATPRTFRFIHKGRTCRVDIPEPFVKLQWGAYLFVPVDERPPGDRRARRRTRRPRGRRPSSNRRRAAKRSSPALLALADEGARGPDRRGRRLEDPSRGFRRQGSRPRRMRRAAIWAAIRLYHAGALKVPYGLVPPRENAARRRAGREQGPGDARAARSRPPLFDVRARWRG